MRAENGAKQKPGRDSALYRWLFRIHEYLGLTIGFVVVITALTGSVAVYWRELKAFANPVYTQPVHSGHRASMDEVYANLQTRFPAHTGAWRIRIPLPPSTSIEAEYYDPPERAHQHGAAMYAVIDPSSGTVMSNWFWNEDLLSWIYTIHMNLQFSEAGHVAVGWIGIVLLLLAFSGLYLWWPRKGRIGRYFTMRFDAPWPRLEYDAHRLAGLYAFPVIALVSLTGINIVFPKEVRAIVGTVTPVEQPARPLRSIQNGDAPRIPPSQALAAAQSLYPGAILQMLITPGSADAVYQIIMRQPFEPFRQNLAQTRIYIDQYSGAVLKATDPSQQPAATRVLGWTYPLHTGEAFGGIGRILVFLSGPVICWLYVSGVLRWLRRRRLRQPARKPITPPVADQI